ncbi:hypothetical protein BKH46_07250 [Helicobacter sp. 12S02634-8]|nr:hypothetical protein BKH46_07250 [Helicobacter sp. 12S02634-8]
MSNAEERSVITKILSLYLLTTFIFLSILFGLYYNKGYDGIIHDKANDLREDFVGLTRIIDRSGKFDTAVFKKVQALGLNLEFIIYDKSGKVLYDGLGLKLDKKKFKKIRKNGAYVVDGYVLIDFNPLIRYKHHKNIYPFTPPPSFDYQIVMKGAYIVPEIWSLRLMTAGLLLLCLLCVGVVAYFLLWLSLRPLKDKITMLNRFIKDSTHEINTPVSVILMSIERLGKEGLKSDDLKKIERIHIAAKTIANIYQNLVLYSFSKNIGQDTHIDLKEILEQRLEFFTPLLVHKNLELLTDLKPASIYASKDALRCIIDNLLSNAIKYNKKGGKIQVTLQASSLRISDSGVGIDGREIDKIFDRYRRCDTSQGGFGIGLALVGELCARYGIKITCVSKLGIGSTFILDFDGSGA